MINHLPRTSHFVAAIAQDEEAAEAALDHDDRDPALAGPHLTEWTPEVQALYGLADRLGTLIQVTLAAGGAKQPKPLPSWPRPRLAIDRVRERRRHQKHQRLVDRVLGRS